MGAEGSKGEKMAIWNPFYQCPSLCRQIKVPIFIQATRAVCNKDIWRATASSLEVCCPRKSCPEGREKRRESKNLKSNFNPFPKMGRTSGDVASSNLVCLFSHHGTLWTPVPKARKRKKMTINPFLEQSGSPCCRTNLTNRREIR